MLFSVGSYLLLRVNTFTTVTVTFDSGYLCAGAAVENNGRTDAHTYLTHPTQTGWDDGGTVTTVDNDLLLSFMAYFDDSDSATFTAGMGWIQVLAEYSTFERNQGILVQSQATGAAGTYDATATTSGAVGGGMETLALRN